MTRWTGIVLAASSTATAEMASRLVAYLHPIAGRPLIWHSVASLATLPAPPERILVVSGVDLPDTLFQDLPVPVEVLLAKDVRAGGLEEQIDVSAERLLAIPATSLPTQREVAVLLDSAAGSWLADDRGGVAAAWVGGEHLARLLPSAVPLEIASGLVSSPPLEVGGDPGAATLVVYNRGALAEATRRVRDRVVRALMDGGVTFLLPDSNLVDVDVRVGRDSIVYPGVVIEGQTTIGEETVVGPGCRIIDSWVGSGVELRGWNYVSHTSIRNRAILEPYVRRGFD